MKLMRSENLFSVTFHLVSPNLFHNCDRHTTFFQNSLLQYVSYLWVKPFSIDFNIRARSIFRADTANLAN